MSSFMSTYASCNYNSGQPLIASKDLSRGLARQMSMAFIGTQIDAVYHTSLVFSGVEYFFGAGIQTSVPGGTHHGRPMEIVPMGRTELPADIILEYVDSLRSIYTPEVSANAS